MRSETLPTSTQNVLTKDPDSVQRRQGLRLAGGGPDGPTGVPIRRRHECPDSGFARSIDTLWRAPSAKAIVTRTFASSSGLGTTVAVAVPAPASDACAKAALVMRIGVLAVSATASRPPLSRLAS